MTQRCSIAVIGAGLVGVCCALSLCRDGHDVVLFEPNEIGGGASFGNAGLISSGACVPTGMPGMAKKLPGMLMSAKGPLAIHWRYLPWILPWFLRLHKASQPARIEQISVALASLLDRAESAYRNLLSKADYRTYIKAKGLLFPYKSEASFEGAAVSRALRERRGVRFEVLDRPQLRQRQPALARDHIKAVYFPEARHVVDPQRLTQSLADLFVEASGTVVTEKVDAIAIDRDGRPVLETSAEQRQFDKVVVATGAWSKPLAAMCGARVPLDTERGYHATLPDPQVKVGVPMISGDYSVAITPMRDGLRVSGMVEFAGLNAAPDFRHADRLITIAEELLPGLSRQGARFWMGFRPSLPDSLPIIGPAPSTDKVLFAFGHGHLGVTYAAVTGQLVADLALGRQSPIDLAPFSATRF